jgi:small-conductance mechanosensitive channel
MTPTSTALPEYLEQLGTHVLSTVRSITEHEGYKAQAAKVFNFTQRNYNYLFFGALGYHFAYSMIVLVTSTAFGFWAEKHVRIQTQERSKSAPISSFFKGSEPKTYLFLLIIAVRLLIDIQISAVITGFFTGMVIRKLFMESAKT